MVRHHVHLIVAVLAFLAACADARSAAAAVQRKIAAAALLKKHREVPGNVPSASPKWKTTAEAATIPAHLLSKVSKPHLLSKPRVQNKAATRVRNIRTAIKGAATRALNIRTAIKGRAHAESRTASNDHHGQNGDSTNGKGGGLALTTRQSGYGNQDGPCPLNQYDNCHCAQTECENAGFTWAFRTEADGGYHCTCEGCSAGYGDENVYSQGQCEALGCYWDGLLAARVQTMMRKFKQTLREKCKAARSWQPTVQTTQNLWPRGGLLHVGWHLHAQLRADCAA